MQRIQQLYQNEVLLNLFNNAPIKWIQEEAVITKKVISVITSCTSAEHKSQDPYYNFTKDLSVLPNSTLK